MTRLLQPAARAAVVSVCILALHAAEARADSCDKSREYILSSMTELQRSPRTYNDLYKGCLETLQMSNVKDAFVLAAGAIAVLPRNDSLAATAGTLAQFCTRFPKYTLRFIGRREARMAKDIAQIVQLGTSQSTPCQKVMGSI